MAKTKKQLKIPGTQEESNRAVDEAAEHYVELRDSRMQATEAEVEARGVLIAAMKKADLTTYRDNGADPPLLVTLTIEEKVKVSRIDEDEASDD